MTPDEAVIEILNDKYPDLLDRAPVILTLCMVYHLRKIQGPPPREENLEDTWGKYRVRTKEMTELMKEIRKK